MEHAQLDSKEWSRLVTRLGGEEALASSAREHGAFIRARVVKSAVDVLRLAFMYGPGGPSLRSLAALAAAAGLADVSDVAILDRLKHAADWLQSLCEDTLSPRTPSHQGAMVGLRCALMFGMGQKRELLFCARTLAFASCGRLVAERQTRLTEGLHMTR